MKKYTSTVPEKKQFSKPTFAGKFWAYSQHNFKLISGSQVTILRFADTASKTVKKLCHFMYKQTK
jgi:hypothetical protein